MKPNYRRDILAFTERTIQGFLYELSLPTRQYRTVHSLQRQLEHEYHGRFTIELIQNAHDQLRLGPGEAGDRVVAFVLDPEEGEFGTLYAANDGRRVTRRDVEALAELGQSPKDPNECVGNKGIGFRSVLEITDSPAVYSCAGVARSQFDGYRLGFIPESLTTLRDYLNALMDSRISAAELSAPRLGPIELNVGLDGDRLANLRSVWSTDVGKSIADELEYLSPYSLPLPIEELTPRLELLAKRGFATVVRMPLRNEAARILVEDRLAALTVDDILFLEEVRFLEIDTPNRKIGFRRDVSCAGQVELSEDRTPSSRRYRIWKTAIGQGGDGVNESALTAAAAGLPGRWPELREAEISIAVQVAESAPETGRFFIFLPTDQTTGTACHINAPFYGEIHRRSIKFDESLNTLLLTGAAELCGKILREEFAEKQKLPSEVALDLIAPTGQDNRFPKLVLESWPESTLAFEDLSLVLTSAGRTALKQVKVLKPLGQASILTPAFIRNIAPVPVVLDEFGERSAALENLIQLVGEDPQLTRSQLADVLEAGARTLQRERDSPEDWIGFWADAERFLPARPGEDHPLTGRKVVPLASGNLGAARRTKSSVRIFFPGGAVDLDEDDTPPGEVPALLRKRIAFVDNRLPLRIVPPGSGRRAAEQTPARRYLGAGRQPLVADYRVETIFSRVIEPAGPDNMVERDSRKAEQCRELLGFALRLLEGARSTEGLLPRLANLRVPCLGGWYPAREVSFGSGWPGMLGETLSDYIDGLHGEAADQARRRLLLGPEEKDWPELPSKIESWLLNAGVARGLRLSPETIPPVDFSMSRDPRRVQVPRNLASGLSEQQWSNYAAALESTIDPSFSGEFEYRLEPGPVFVGLNEFGTLSAASNYALCRLLLESIPGWGDKWRKSTFEKKEGQSHRGQVESALHHVLRTSPWVVPLPSSKVDVESGKDRYVPADCWHVGHVEPRAMRFYQHLSILPRSAAQILEYHTERIDALEELGMPRLDRDAGPSDPVRLLDDCATAVEQNRVVEINRSMFVSHLNAGWTALFERNGDSLPEKLVARLGSEFRVIDKEWADHLFVRDVGGNLEVDIATDIYLMEFPITPPAHLVSSLERWGAAKVCRFSKISRELRVGGKVWPTSQQVLTDLSALGDVLPWLPAFVLSVVGLSTGQLRELSSKVSRLRITKLVDTESDPIEERWLWEDQELSRRREIAVWSRRDDALLIDTSVDRWWIELAAPLAMLLDRERHRDRIRLALRCLPSATPDRAALESALEEVRVDKQLFNELRQHWLGEFQWVLSRVQAVLNLFDIEFNPSHLKTVEDIDSLSSLLSDLSGLPLAADDLLHIVRGAEDDRTLGKALYKRVGTLGELARWNEALARLDERPVVRNPEVLESCELHLREAEIAIRSVVRRVVAECKSTWPDFIEAVDSVTPPKMWETQRWEVSFREAVGLLEPVLARHGAPAETLEKILSSETVEQLESQLGALGYEPNVDPEDLFTENFRCIENAVDDIRRVAIIWLQGKGFDPKGWESLPDLSVVSEELGQGIGYLAPLSEKAVYKHALSVLRDRRPMADLQVQMDKSNSVDDLLDRLGIARSSLAGADEVLSRAREERFKKLREHEICGETFDIDDVDWLASRLRKMLPERTGKSVDLENPITLGEPPTRPKRTKGTGGGMGGSPKPLKRKLNDVVGMVGEYHAFRYLRNTYGKKVVRPRNWVSSYSRRFFPKNTADDDLGYDFDLDIGGCRTFVEVKSTQGEEEQFEFGPSEVRCAAEVGRMAGLRRYLILRVTRATSREPGFQVLPNPMDTESESRYSFDPRGLYVHYSTEKG